LPFEVLTLRSLLGPAETQVYPGSMSFEEATAAASNWQAVSRLSAGKSLPTLES
jgi:hypothetical protein